MTDPTVDTDLEELEGQVPAARPIYAPDNAGQVAGYVRGDMVQNLSIVRKVVGLREAHELGPLYVRQIREDYVRRSFTSGTYPSLDLPDVVELLRARHHLTLIGDPGTGRRTAAVSVLGGLGVPLEEIPGWDAGQPGQFTVADLPAEPGKGYLFVHPDGDLAGPDLGDELRAYEEKLASSGSFLVFVATSTAWDALGRSWSDTVLTVGCPDRHELLRKTVQRRRPGRDLSGLLASNSIVGLIEKASPRDIERLGGLVGDVDEMTDWQAEKAFDEAVSNVVNGYQEWTSVITKWLKDHQTAEERLFLLAAAVLEGTPAGQILRHAEELRILLPADAVRKSHSIAGPGLRELADRIGADLDGPLRRLRFRRAAYATAVVDYFLSDRSDIFRRTVAEWLANTPGAGRSAQSAVAEVVADSVLEFVRRQNDLAFAFPIMNRWASRPPLRGVLVSLVTAVALSSEVGSQMRTRLNIWASRSGSQQLLEVVADVCTGDLADAYPRLALTRISNLALRADGPLVGITAQALRKLWERTSLRAEILRRLWSWLNDRDAPVFAVGTRVLADLGVEVIRVAYERRLDRDPLLSAAIANLLVNPDEPELLRSTLYGWLDSAVADEQLADWLIGVIAASIPGPGSALRVSCVHTFAFGWESQDVDSPRARLRQRLVERASLADDIIGGWALATMTAGGPA